MPHIRKSSVSDGDIIARAVQHFMGGLYDPDMFALVSKEELRDMWSDGQIQSKISLLKSLRSRVNLPFRMPGTIGPRKVIVVGGWMGQLAYMINQMPGWSADTLDIDARVHAIASRMAEPNLAITHDMIGFDYRPYEVIVNTSCEHVADLQPWLSGLIPGQTVVLQSNDALGIAGHVNCVSSLLEFRKQITDVRGLTVLDERAIVLPQYTRFQIIGVLD